MNNVEIFYNGLLCSVNNFKDLSKLLFEKFSNINVALPDYNFTSIIIRSYKDKKKD